MEKQQSSKRVVSALIVTAVLAAVFLLIAAYGPGSGTQTASARNIAGIAPAHESETREPTQTHHPEGTETAHPERTETQRPEQTRTPEATRTHEVEPSETRDPEGTVTPHATRTSEPEGTETPHATRTREVEPTETQEPEGTETPEATRTLHPEPSETHHPEGTRTPEATETGEPEGTHTPRPTHTQMPSPVPTGQAPVVRSGANGASVSVPGTGSRTFAPTGKAVQGIFLQYWDRNGGLMQQGYPISTVMQERSPLDGKTYAVQYFERAVFEYHPELSGSYTVLLSQLGHFRYNSRYPTGVSGQIVDKTNGVYFVQTGHYVGGAFLTYWQQHGGLAQQGYPLSDEFTEISPLDGKTYWVQYFERAVFELHPENKAPFNVLLSQLGTFQYQSQYKTK